MEDCTNQTKTSDSGERMSHAGDHRDRASGRKQRDTLIDQCDFLFSSNDALTQLRGRLHNLSRNDLFVSRKRGISGPFDLKSIE